MEFLDLCMCVAETFRSNWGSLGEFLDLCMCVAETFRSNWGFLGSFETCVCVWQGDVRQAGVPQRLQVYVAETLATLPYLVHDEPLFVVHELVALSAVTGAELLAVRAWSYVCKADCCKVN